MEKIDEFLNKNIFSDISKYAELARSFKLSFPLNFENDAEELTLVGLIALVGLTIGAAHKDPIAEMSLRALAAQLDFGTEYDSILCEHLDRDAFDIVQSFVFSLYLSSATSSESALEDALSSRRMQNASLDDVASHMRISIVVEKPHPTIPAITIGEQGGPLLPFVQRVVKVLRETGDFLVKQGYANFGVFLEEGLKEAKGDPEILVSRLVRAVPPFNDAFTGVHKGDSSNLRHLRQNQI